MGVIPSAGMIDEMRGADPAAMRTQNHQEDHHVNAQAQQCQVINGLLRGLAAELELLDLAAVCDKIASEEQANRPVEMARTSDQQHEVRNDTAVEWSYPGRRA